MHRNICQNKCDDRKYAKYDGEHRMLTIENIGFDCVGCRSCEQSCPRKCIKMKENQEGFLYPCIDKSECVECGICLKKCPVSETYTNKRNPIHVYALKERDAVQVFESASGGASDAIVNAVLSRNGIVYGAAYDTNLSVQHIEVTDQVGRRKIQSSKYVQSNLKDCYLKAKSRLQEGKIVLFTGTPCQIDGLYAFLEKDYENLYTIDLICHGTPSPKFFEKYLLWCEERMGEKVLSYNFRSKEKRGWGTQCLIKSKTKKKTKALALDKYGKHFTAGDCYRESCYRCRYANIHHPADITIGDFWGVEQCHPEFSSNLGVSTVFVNSEKGNQMMEWIEHSVECIPITVEEALIKQGNLKHPTSRPKTRSDFYMQIDEKRFIHNMKVGIQPIERIKSVLPVSLIKKLKSNFKV